MRFLARLLKPKSLLQRYQAQLAGFVIGFLGITAFVLGAAVYLKYYPAPTFLAWLIQTKATSSTALLSAQIESDILRNVPGPSAPEYEKRLHFESALQIAKEAEFLDVTECAFTPVVLKLKLNQEFIVKNRGDISHEIYVDADHRYIIPPKDEKIITADFGRGAIFYGVGCDTYTQPAGFFLVEL